jgi:hypothetical protein
VRVSIWGASYGDGDGSCVMFKSMVLPSPSCWSEVFGMKNGR